MPELGTKKFGSFLSEDPFVFGLCVSLTLHLVIVYFILFKFAPSVPDFSPPTIYSVTLEGGASLGGRSQVPTAKTPIAPPKNVSSELPKTVEPKTVEKEPKKESEVKVPEKDAEVSVAEKKVEVKPTAKPTPQTAPKKEPTPKATAAKPVEKKVTTPPSDPNKDYQKAMQRYLGESAKAGGKTFGAAALGGKGFGGGTQESAEFIGYFNLLTAHIKKGWRWSDTNKAYLAKVSFILEADGRIHSIQLKSSSGVKEFDDSVIRAIAKADPAPPPPASVYLRFHQSVMRFDPREF